MMANEETRKGVRKIEGRYANYFEIGHNAFEFIIDFGQYYPNGRQAKFFSRVVTAPAYAKAFLELLEKSIIQYENQFGVIKENQEEN